MKSAVFALAGLVFALGLAGTLGGGYENYGSGYGSYGGYDSYGAEYNSGYGGRGGNGYSGYGHKGQMGTYETTVHVPYAVPVPQAMPLPAYGAVGGGNSDGGLFGDDTLSLIAPLMIFFLLSSSNVNINLG